jgi:hypothetical protein
MIGLTPRAASARRYFVVVIAAVGDQLVGAQPRPADVPANRPEAIDEGQQLGNVVAGCRRSG